MRKTLDLITTAGFYLVVLFSAAAIYTAFTAESTDKDPSGGAGLYAAMVAMFTGAMLVLEKESTRRLSRWKSLPRVLICLSAMVGAYLWIAAESNVLPGNRELVRGVTAVWLITAILAIALGLWASVFTSTLNDRDTNNETER